MVQKNTPKRMRFGVSILKIKRLKSKQRYSQRIFKSEREDDKAVPDSLARYDFSAWIRFFQKKVVIVFVVYPNVFRRTCVKDVLRLFIPDRHDVICVAYRCTFIAKHGRYLRISKVDTLHGNFAFSSIIITAMVMLKVFQNKHFYRLRIVFMQTEDEAKKVKEIFGVNHFHKFTIDRKNEETSCSALLLTDTEYPSEKLNEIMRMYPFILSIQREDDD